MPLLHCSLHPQATLPLSWEQMSKQKWCSCPISIHESIVLDSFVSTKATNGINIMTIKMSLATAFTSTRPGLNTRVLIKVHFYSRLLLHKIHTICEFSRQYQDDCLLGCCILWSGRRVLMSSWHLLHPSSGRWAISSSRWKRQQALLKCQ